MLRYFIEYILIFNDNIRIRKGTSSINVILI